MLKYIFKYFGPSISMIARAAFTLFAVFCLIIYTIVYDLGFLKEFVTEYTLPKLWRMSESIGSYY